MSKLVSSCLYVLIFAVLHQRLYNIKWIACSFFLYIIFFKNRALKFVTGTQCFLRQPRLDLPLPDSWLHHDRFTSPLLSSSRHFFPTSQLFMFLSGRLQQKCRNWRVSTRETYDTVADCRVTVAEWRHWTEGCHSS